MPVLELIVAGLAAGLVAAALCAGRVRRSARRAHAEREFLESILNHIGDPVFVKDRDHRLVFVNEAECRLAGRDRAQLVGKTDYDIFPKDQVDVFWKQDDLVFETGEENVNEEVVTDGSGAVRTVVTKKTLHVDANGGRHLVGVIRDITDRKRAQEEAQRFQGELERKRLEEQLRQVQKMESVGMLAGGIAHDFNNLLTPIIGGCELLMPDAVSSTEREVLRDVMQAALRLKDLTQHLLAFGRKQMLDLARLDLAEVATRFERMLRRTIREDIAIRLHFASELGAVLADAGQIEQVLLNLTINAQDAMPRGGVLAIEGENVELDEAYARLHPGMQPGPYVLLGVSDTGTGMDEQTQERLFEPFFTTKERGKGTGLGLSMVYGIVKQHGGTVSVYSEPGRGTTFKLYLPRAPETGDTAARSAPGPDAQVGARDGETVLVLEDNEMVRHTACEMLNRLGYRVLSADSAEACLRLAAGRSGAIDLLLTDVILPHSNGKEVFERLRAERARLKVIYMSGYTSNVIVHHGIVDEGVHFLNKPLSLRSLSRKLREALDAP